MRERNKSNGMNGSLRRSRPGAFPAQECGGLSAPVSGIPLQAGPPVRNRSPGAGVPAGHGRTMRNSALFETGVKEITDRRLLSNANVLVFDAAVQAGTTKV